MLTSEVCPQKGVRSRTAPAMCLTYTRWGEPTVLYSKGAKEIDNVSPPRSAFTNQALHCDINPKITNANAQKRRNGTPIKRFPYSVIINCSPEDAILRGAGLSSMEAIVIDESIGEDHDFNCYNHHQYMHHHHHYIVILFKLIINKCRHYQQQQQRQYHTNSHNHRSHRHHHHH